MKLAIFQKGFNFSQDGPGNRLVYHLQGCNLRCPWCSNPEGLEPTGGKQVSIDELMEEVCRSKMMFFDGGGVTLTGGEVTTQFDVVKVFLTVLHNEGIHTCIETNGISPRLPELFDNLDLLIMDIKHYNPKIHQAFTGAENLRTIQNITAALTANQPLVLRIPLIGGFNSSEQDAHGFVSLFRELGIGTNVTIELLTYHEYGKDKYASLGRPYRMTDEARVSKQQLKEFTEILGTAGFRIIRT